MRIRNLFSSDPYPAQLKNKIGSGSGSGSDLNSKWKKKNMYFNEKKYLYYSNRNPPIRSFGFIPEFSWMEFRQSIVVAIIFWFWFIFYSRWKKFNLSVVTGRIRIRWKSNGSGSGSSSLLLSIIDLGNHHRYVGLQEPWRIRSVFFFFDPDPSQGYQRCNKSVDSKYRYKDLRFVFLYTGIPDRSFLTVFREIFHFFSLYPYGR